MSGKLKKFLNSSKFKGDNSCKNKSITPKTLTGTLYYKTINHGSMQ
jgi:hypothetical protein